ncbi:transketolase C-terminal domain-containing protein, partial [Chloroflexota bacterium]
MPRLVGLALASRLYRELPELQQYKHFSIEGREIAWGSIGNASTAEGMFWESINAIGVLRAPAIITIYDDGFGISVPNQFQMVKENISTLLSGFQREPCPADFCDRGYNIYTVPAWDYPSLLEVYSIAAKNARQNHIPALVHATEATQPQGHSTSGSHERYKSTERLNWENEFDGLKKMRDWIMEMGFASETKIIGWEKEDHQIVEYERQAAWESFTTPLFAERQEITDLLAELAAQSQHNAEISAIREHLNGLPQPNRKNIHIAIHKTLMATRNEASLPNRQKLLNWKLDQEILQSDRYSSHLYSQTTDSVLKVPHIKKIYSENSATMMAYEVLNTYFDYALKNDPRVIAFGEDVGNLGDVNQAFRDLQVKYGSLRVSDTGIREVTILGQAIGLAMRGLRPIAEIQYLDYLLYALQILSDDLATLLWRTKGGQKAPVIIRTRGHRLEGIWHSGSPMAGIINLARGLNVLVPRNAVQAAGFYNTLMKSDEPGLIVEVLNGYRLKERLPDNIGKFTVPLGIPEKLRNGDDLTIVTYGACCRLALEAANKLSSVNIKAEIIDVQSLLPFDIHEMILKSLKKTSRIMFLDEDVPGGATAYMLQQVIEKQGGFYWLDSPPRTLSAKPHRPAYGSDGDYWSKPNVETIFDEAYN